ncbi:gliding motility-associated-like protein/uncharacterized repeat protein (TIGR01451 family) [Saonia flava]|uniref:Gliding motility-associated-like protein/uncharacterized repeat protein (TIGR01451 family) n=1 Tax=Saonia flava TaxID=523696 RepID=A0A846QTU3_9FLAO|nr:T9SS type B sorting domain-containing protein [Saonia flava]NJB71468.1 gliding motility-associated-like protein/uncharacterized repeat protein (TIGR01451 family) [Saonia flava]
MNKAFIKKLLFISIFLCSLIGFSQEYNNFEVRYQNNIKGNLTFLANNIVNRDGGTSTTEPEDPYDNLNNSGSSGSWNRNPETGGYYNYNDYKDMQYINVDGGPGIFNSSSATLTYEQADCNLIRYAGLYWSATYPSANAGDPVGTGRQNDFNQVKLKVPNGSYVDVFADEILYDGFTSADNSMRQNSPYACYADVTSLITPLANPEGEYTIANIRSVQGSLSPGGGAAGGWTLVIVYENPTLTGKLITTFDGFARVRSANPQIDINYNGFNTIPAGPVRANIGAAALEGDFRISGDQMRISSASSGGAFTTISNATNPANNFFNSNITLNGVATTNRTPNSANTLGYDTDMFLLNNPTNSVIPNSETAATFRFTSSGDQYYPFFNSFNVEIIEPNIVVEKKVEDIAGNDITGLGVNLGQQLDYVLSFQNTGNDNATNYVLRDVLPENVTYIPANLILPTGFPPENVSYDPVTHVITFNVPDGLVQEGDPVSSIRLRVRVAENCFDFVNACTDLIQNLAYSTYEGVINNNQITDDPSVSDFDDCGFITPGATNFLLDDLEDCDFSRTVQMCGADVLLDAGDNFDDYIWYRDVNGDNLIDSGDTIITDGDSDNDLSTLLVNQVGTYIVDKIVADPCKGFQEIITVELFGASLPNPITDLINDTSNTVEGQILVCPNDGEELPEIFLCGLNDTESILINIPDATSISWEQLDEASCGSAPADCANKNGSCTWNNVGSGSSFLASDAGEYRVVINYQNGCSSRFYFNVFKNPLDPQYNSSDLICTTPGNITVTNMPVDYEYQLLDATDSSILVPYSANNGPSFTISSNGAYTVEMRQVGVVNGCVFRLEDIGILTRNFQVDVTTRDTDCNGLGEISISALNVEPQYYYEISQGGTPVDTFGPSNDNNYTFENLNDGVYDVLVTTDDGCTYTEQVTINDLTDLDLDAVISQHISCREGNIQMNSTGGQTPHSYAIWSYIDEGGTTITSYPTVNDIPASEYQTSVIFDILDPGDYTFVVVDRNNCHAFSNTVTITLVPAVEYTTSIIDESCFGAEDGSIVYNMTATNGYKVDYSILYPDGSIVTNASGTFNNLPQGDYTVTLTQSKGGSSCDYLETFTIGGPADAVSGTAVLTQDYTCLQDGIIEAQSVVGGASPYEYSIDGVNFVSGIGAETFSGLANGTYNITVRDANNCTFVTNTITIDPLNEPSDLTFSATQPNCPSLTSDVTVTVVDGNTPFVFEIIAPSAIAASSSAGSSALFNGLSPNTYTFRVTDDKGCFYDESFTIGPVSPINVVGQLISNITCFSDTDGEALFTISGFNTSYDYSITGPATFSGTGETGTTIPLSGLDDGTYTITVTDNDTNCTDTASVTIAGPSAALTLSAIETQPTCIADGSVALTATGGWGGNSFTLTNPDASPFGTNTTGNFSGLTQTGLYSASVTDTNGCLVTTTFTLDPVIAPVLEIVPNDICYDSGVGLTLTANVTSGGDGNYEYSLNGGVYTTSNVFSGLAPGTHTIEVRDGKSCVDTETISIDPELTVTASASNIAACGTTTNVVITAAGGDGNYVYALVGNGVTPNGGDFGASNSISVTGAGDYDVYVRDKNGGANFCEVNYDINVAQDAPVAISVSHTDILCSGEATSTITITASGGEAPYTYSINNGGTYQPSNTFVNQAAGSYNIRVRDANNCEVTQIYNITEPFTLSASAAVTELVECNPSAGGEVRITNAQGGTAPYEYSFDGGSSYVASSIGYLMPGTHTVYIRDANGCDFPMTVTIDPEPTPPTATASIDYECDGEGTITITPSSGSFDYTYELDGVLNTPSTSNIFSDATVGSHTLTVNYLSNTPSAPSNLLLESFGFGANTSITQIDPAYCYEPQDGSVSLCGFGTDTHIQDGEYSVTQVISNPYGSWQSPNDHTGNANGRFLAINVGGVAGVGGIVYAKRNVEVIANRDITVSLWAFNLLRNGTSGGDPTIEIQLVDGGGAVIASTATGNVPKNFNADDWHNYTVTLDPGANTNLDIVIRTNSAVVNGNDIAIDDIQAFQTPEPCPGSFDIDILIEGGYEFMASSSSVSSTTCNGSLDGSITFDIENFDAVNGYQYSVDGNPFSGPQTSSPITVNGLGAGTHTIVVQDVLDNSCSITITETITNPTSVVSVASMTSPLTCVNGATITASASGGTPTYQYQLEDTLGNPIAGYDFATNTTNNVFTVNTPGDYHVRVRDANLCEDITDTAITISVPENIVFTSTPTACYSGANDGTILVDVTAGNGGYQFSINGGPWMVPSPTTSTTYSFNNLSNGSYTIDVRDQYSCVGVQQNITINPALTLSATAPNITSCATTTDVTISAAGGDGNLVYAIVSDGVSPVPGDFGVANPITITGAGDYDVYVRDNNGNVSFCETSFDLTIIQDDPIVITPTATPNTCFGGTTGAVSLAVSGGNAPYDYSIDNGTTYQTTADFFNLPAGTYNIRVRDNNNCEQTSSIDVTQPDQIVAEATQTLAYTCLQLGEISIGSVTPTTGGSGNYQYSLNGGAWTAATTGGTVFNNLTDGTYTITVRDANDVSCTITLPNIIVDPLPAEPTLSTSIVYNCDGSGNITVLPNDVTYTYSIDAGAAQASNVFNNIAVGSHTITVDYGSDCTVDTIVVIENGHAIEANITDSTNTTCNSDLDGSITFEVNNFGVGGFEYSIDGFTTVLGSSTSSPETITGLGAGSYTITVRDVNNPIAGCTIILNQDIIEPIPVVASATVTDELTCSNGGATITASATGGTPTYQYQLEDDLGAVITVYQSSTIFNGVPAGDYIIRARDTNLCSDPIDIAITVAAPDPIIFTSTPTACYSGANDGTIVVDVTSGNGGYQFSLNSGPWITPSPATATTHTFSNLVAGSYTIDVRDEYGCVVVQQTAVINNQLLATVTVTDIGTCTDGSISVAASGGDGSYEYAFVPTTTDPTGFFGPANTYTVTTGNDGVYDVYVRDNSAAVPFCELMETVTVNPAVPLTFTATPNDPECHDGLGSIDVNIVSGTTPYTIEIIDLDNAGASDQTNTNVFTATTTFYNLLPGDYTINVTDSFGCLVTDTPVTITNPDELTADITAILPAACSSVDPNDYGFQFSNYPTTLGTIEFSADGGATWTGDNSIPGTTDVLTGYISGTNVYPSLRTVDGLGNTICQTDLPRYTIPYPLDDLDITISTVVVGCNELQVTVQGTEGVPNYEYTYTDNPSNFNPPSGWTAAIPGSHTWTGLIPGRTYVFYVRDSSGCLRQSNVNVNDITTNPIEISAAFEPSCSGANDAEITYTLTDTDGSIEPSMRWELFDVNTGLVVQSSGGNIAYSPTITVTGISPAEYYIVVTEVNAGNTDVCVSGSENLLIEELDPISATLSSPQNITCSTPGLILIDDIIGGGGTYTYTVSGPAPFVTITGTTDNPVEIIPGSPAGTYTVLVEDQYGCSFTDTINVDLDPRPEISLEVVSNCPDEGEFQLIVTLDTPGIGAPYFLSLNGGAYQNIVFDGSNQYIITDLSSGAGQTVAVADLNGCPDTDPFTIYPPLEFTAVQTELLDCEGPPNNNAEITITVTSGSGNYDYEIVGPISEGRVAMPSNPFTWTQASVAGTYSVVVYDVGTPVPYCQRTIDVEAPPAITPIFTHVPTDVTCNGLDNGTIAVFETDNGINPLTYTISPVAGTFNASNNTFEGLPPGTYAVTGLGTNNCTTTIPGIVIDEPDIIDNVNATVVEFGCSAGNNPNNASISIDGAAITGGTGTYVIYEFINDQGTPMVPGDDVVVQSGSNTTYVETNTTGGSYIINVYDENGCSGSTTATILPYDELLSATASITNPLSCNPGMDGEITITVTSVNSDLSRFRYSIDNGTTYQASNVFTGLSAGTHNFLIRHIDTGCIITASETITDPNTFTIDVVKIQDVICFGTATGGVTFELVDVTYPGDFDWEIFNTNGTASTLDDTSVLTGNEPTNGPTATINLPAGEYYVNITQSNFPTCTNTEFFNIDGPSAAITANTNVTEVTCALNDGSIEIIDVLGGWAGYTYFVDLASNPAPTFPGSYQASPLFPGLSGGALGTDYQVWVVDQFGCELQLPDVTLIDPTPISATLQINQANCTNLEGEIEVIGTSGGQGTGYTYQLYRNGSPQGTPQTSTIFSGLGAGSYTVEINDQWNCTFTTLAEVLYDEMSLLATIVKPIDCTINPGGEITITQNGGSGSYDYSVTFPDAVTTINNTTGVFTGLTQVGDYTFTVTDQADACSKNIVRRLEDAIQPIISITNYTDVTCNGNSDGTISVSATDNGIGPYTFEITSPVSILPTSNTANTAVFTGLDGLAAPGITYTIRVTAANGCVETLTQVILQPDIIDNVNATVVEFGCSAGNNPNNASISIDGSAITGGTGTYVIYEFINDQGTPMVPGDDVVVQSGSNTTYVETNTTGGSYIINVYDENGCSGSTTATILPYDELLSATASITNPLSCNPGMDGEITITVTSVNSDLSRFRYSIDNGTTYQASNVFTGLSAGTHNFLIRHIDTGCIITASETITDPNTFTIDVVKIQDVICFGTETGEITLQLVDATYVGPFNWVIYDSNGTANTIDDTFVKNGTFPNNGPTAPITLEAGSYIVEVLQNNFPQCTNIEAFNISGPSAAITANTNITPVTCSLNDGAIEVIDVLGGWGGYTYFVDLASNPAPTFPGSYQASPLFTGLAGGPGLGTDYQVWVADVNGCVEQLSNVNLVDPTPISAALQVNQENCTNLEGEIEVVGTVGGQGSNYTYQLIKDGVAFGSTQTSTVFSGLGAGSYEVLVTDQWSCSFTTPAELLYEEMNLVSTVVKPIDCTVAPGGEITITVNGGSANLDYTVTFPDAVTTINNATGVFTGLNQAGTYTFVVNDLDTTNPVCTKTITEMLDTPTPVTFDAPTRTHVSCNGGADGEVTINLTAPSLGVNDNPIYTYTLYDALGATIVQPAQTSPTFTGLSAAFYQVEVISSRGCLDRQTFEITEPSVLTATATATTFACNASNTATTSTITVVPGGGTAPYLYSIDGVNFQSSTTFDIIDNGAIQNITVTVVDANNCSVPAVVAPIQPLNVFTAIVSRNIAISCVNPEEILITVADNGNPLNTYTYELLPIGNPNGSLTATPTNITTIFDLTAVGNYTFRITDTTTGCYFDTAPYEILPYDLIEVVATATTPITCFGGSNGAAEINISGYTSAYMYEVYNSSTGLTTGITGTGNTSVNPNTINGLPGGNYFVRITETTAPECVEDSNSFTIISPDMPLTAVVDPIADTTCTDDQGEIIVNPSGGYAPYDIVLTNTTTSQSYTINDVASHIFTGLSAGSFTVEITDAGGCIINDTEVLVPAIPITADITATPTTLVCFGDTNAIVTAINVINGQGIYQYQLNTYDPTGTVIDFTSGAQISPVFDNLGAGIYSITVSDGWNCGIETVQVTITEPIDVFSSLVQLSQMTCNNQAQIQLFAAGGTGPYEFSADGTTYTPMSGGNSHTFTVADGVYQYYVRDSFGCDAMQSNQISIEPVPPLMIDIDDSAAVINCTGEATATIVATASGGLGNYSYELYGDAALTSLISGPQSTGLFSNLIAGSYYVHVTSLDCEETSAEILIVDPLPLQIDLQDFTDVTCNGADDGTITVEVSGGTGEILYAISPTLNQFDTENVFTDLAPGDYDVIAQDENGCFLVFQFTISEPNPLDVTYTALPEVCAGNEDGSISVAITGGTAPYSTAFNSNNDADFVQDQTLFTDLAAGTYVIFVRDAQDCETNIIVEIEAGVNLNGIVTPIYTCSDDMPTASIDLLFEDPSVSGDVMYALDSTDPMDLQLDYDFGDIAPGPHTLTISHANGCINTIDFVIDAFEPLTLVLEQNNINEITAIATGGTQNYTFTFDGINNGDENTYYITRTDTYTVTVTDENGCTVSAEIFMEFIDIEIPNFFTPDGDGMNDFWVPENIEQFPEILTIIFDRYGREVYRMELNDAGWDGLYQNSELPTGDYWYIIKLMGENDDREFVGHFTLYR